MRATNEGTLPSSEPGSATGQLHDDVRGLDHRGRLVADAELRDDVAELERVAAEPRGRGARSRDARHLRADQAVARRTQSVPARRLGTPEEFGAACAFLCSQQAGYITGQNWLLDGGAYPGTF